MDTETENTAEGTQEDSIETLEIEYKQVFSRLRTQHKAFVTEYLKELDSVEAAIKAGYSRKSANKQGMRLRRNENISLLVSLQQRINSLKGKLTTEWVLKELKVRYEACVLDKREQAATANLNLIGQHLGMFGKGKDGGDLHLHDHKKYVNYPPVPESIQEWVDQMKQVGYDAALPVTPVTSEEEGKDEQEGNQGKQTIIQVEGKDESITSDTSTTKAHNGM